MSQADLSTIIVRVGKDTTIPLPCRGRDRIAWIRGTGMFSDPTNGISVLDFWDLRPGDTVTITNRYEDLPVWFVIHPTEVTGRYALQLLKELRAGREVGEISDGPNIWRVEAGDKLAWTGETRPGFEAAAGVLRVFDFRNSCLVLGSPRDQSMEGWTSFGAPDPDRVDEDGVNAIRAALSMVRNLGAPRVVSAGEWKLG